MKTFLHYAPFAIILILLALVGFSKPSYLFSAIWIVVQLLHKH